MTKKDYAAIADVLFVVGLRVDNGDLPTIPKSLIVDTVARELCIVLKKDNPNFDHERFLKACGV